jgi:hypothetical protein
MSDTFSSLIERGATAADIAAHLDALEEVTRILEVRGVSAALQRKLWSIVEGNGVSLESFLPERDETVIYAGKNSLPLFRLFEKRFVRKNEGAVFGYNEQFWRLFTGPGFFVVREDQSGELLFDYTQTPQQAPAGWPRARGHMGIGYLVYGGMIDRNRRVSKHTVLGAAFRRGKAIGQYYLLTKTTPQVKALGPGTDQSPSRNPT